MMKLLVETELFDNDPSATWDYLNLSLIHI